MIVRGDSGDSGLPGPGPGPFLDGILLWDTRDRSLTSCQRRNISPAGRAGLAAGRRPELQIPARTTSGLVCRHERCTGRCTQAVYREAGTGPGYCQESHIGPGITRIARIAIIARIVRIAIIAVLRKSGLFARFQASGRLSGLTFARFQASGRLSGLTLARFQASRRLSGPAFARFQASRRGF